MSKAHEYDIVVIGSGIAGSSMAMVLSQSGLRILVIEKHAHPRFALGESTVPTTALAFCARFAKLARVAHETKDWSHEQFQPLEGTFFAELIHVDRLIDGCIQAGGNYRPLLRLD